MRQFFNQHKVRIIFTGILFAVFLAVGFNLFYGELRKRSKAAPTGTPILYLEPVNSPPMNADRGMKIAIKLDPNGATQELYSFDIQVKFNADKFEFNNGNLDNSMMLNPDIIKQQAVLEGTDTVHIIGTKTTNPFSSTNQEIGSIFFKMKTGKDFPVEFTWGEAILQTSNFVKIPFNLSSNSTSSSSSSSSQNADEVKLTFSSSLIQYHIGDTINLELIVDSGAKQFGSVGAGFVFDPALLDYKSTAVDTSKFDQTNVVVPPPAGQSFITVSAASKTPISGTVKLATVTFRAKATGNVNFAYTKDKSSVYTFGASPQNILTTVNPYSIAIVAISSSSSSTPSEYEPPGVEEESKGDLLHVNSNAAYPSPFRYEQTMTLPSTEYVLSGLAKVYTSKGKGAQLVLFCGEADCNNGKKLNDVIAKTPHFKISTVFLRQEVGFKIINGPKKYTLKLFVDDGTEADFDYISIKNIWDGELVENWHFEKKSSVSYPRRYPDGWTVDSVGAMYGGLYNQWDPANTGMLYINSSAR